MFVILLATYNGENYIEKQIDSILNQSYDDWQLVISDDGSSDRTVDIIESYVRDYPGKISFIRNQSGLRGAYGNFMNLLNQAPEGDCYAFCDQDDEWYTDKLQVMAKHFNESNTKPLLVYHDLRVVDSEKNVLGDGFRAYTKLGDREWNGFYTLMKYNITPGCSVCFNHRLRELIITPKNPVSIHDWWTMLVAAAFGDIVREDKVLGIYRQHDSNTLGIVEKSSGLGLVGRYLKPGRLRWVFAQIRSAKKEAHSMLKEFFASYGNELEGELREHLKKYIHYLETNNKLSALLYGFKKQNRQKGVVKTVYYWMCSL
ncbi:MAG: glycosyltransferase family 2 protein [Lachnospiraceae bacterium]|nr:glycosyltransferase family 2 protein [Lachnospiraceae bacterium]